MIVHVPLSEVPNGVEKGVFPPGNIDLNSVNFLYNGLKEAFDAARRGGDSPLLDQMFAGLNIGGTGCNGVPGSATCGRCRSSSRKCR